MGLRSWLFPSPTERLERARAKLAAGAWAEARLDALDLGTLAGAREVVELAEEGLASLNLEAAVAASASGEPERVAAYFELARRFAAGRLAPAFADARARIAEHERARAIERRRHEQDEAIRISEIDPRFKDTHGEDEIPLPSGLSDADAEAVKVRLGMVLEAWPDALRDQMIPLGATFAEAVLELDEGRPEAARALLLALPDDAALVQHERARAAEALGDLPAAIAAWRAFADLAGGHHAIGRHHTGVLLARDLAIAGEHDEALALLTSLHEEAPDLAPGLHADVLARAGRLDEASAMYEDLLRRHGPHARLLVAYAKVRVAAGDPGRAIAALTRAVERDDQAPDLESHRLLATLRLEAGDRGDDVVAIAEIARALVERPEWDDVYLAALVARVTDDARWVDLAERLREVTAPTDPRWAKVAAHLG